MIIYWSKLPANVSDPPLQRKKKPVEKPLTVTTSFDAKDTASDDYILLGDQSKFAPNIKYTVHGRSKENVTPNVQVGTWHLSGKVECEKSPCKSVAWWLATHCTTLSGSPWGLEKPWI